MRTRIRARFATVLAGIVVAALLPTTLQATAASAAATEILTNGTFSSATAGWSTLGGASVGAASTSYSAGGGAVVGNRTVAADGTYQSVANKLVLGETYTASAWLLFRDNGPATGTFSYRISDAAGYSAVVAGGVVAKTTTNQWTRISGSFTVPAELDLSSAKVSLQTESEVVGNPINRFFADDVSLLGTRAPDTGAAPARSVGNANPLTDYQYNADPWLMEYDGRVYAYLSGDGFEITPSGRIVQKNETDATGAVKNNTYTQIKTITVLSTTDLVNWTNEGNIAVAGKGNNVDNTVDNGVGIAKWAAASWAPAVAHKTIDGKERFFLYFGNNAGSIGVLTSDSPVGPWVDPLGEPLITSSKIAAAGIDKSFVDEALNGSTVNTVWMFDPAVLIDDDGAGYIYFGGGSPTVTQNAGESAESFTARKNAAAEHPMTSRAMRLGDDMTSLVGKAYAIDAPAILEDSGINKIGDKYYYSYCTNGSHNVDMMVDGVPTKVGKTTIAYMVSDSPLGPFTFVGDMMANPTAFGYEWSNNHHSILELSDELGGGWYMGYHTVALGAQLGGNKGFRSGQLDRFELAPDGTFPTIVWKADNTLGTTDRGIAMTKTGPAQLAPLPAYQRIEAETIAWDSGLNFPEVVKPESGIRVEKLASTNDQGQKLTNLDPGEWTALSDVDFGSQGSAGVTISAAGRAGGSVQVRLDSRTSAPVATVAIPAGSGTDYADRSAVLEGVTGVHDVFFTYTGAAGTLGLFDLDHLRFTEPRPTTTSIAVTTPPTKVEYGVGAPIDPSGLVVTATMSDGSTRALTPAEYTLGGFDSSSSGTRTVTVSLVSDPTKTAAFSVTITPAAPVLTSAPTVKTQCIAGRVTLTVAAGNTSGAPIDVTITSPSGSKTISGVAPGKNASHAFSTRSASVPAGSVTVAATASIDGKTVSATRTATYAAVTCG